MLEGDDLEGLRAAQMGAVPAVFFFNDTATTEIYALALHAALPICPRAVGAGRAQGAAAGAEAAAPERHTARAPAHRPARRRRRQQRAVRHRQIATAHACTPVTIRPPMPPSA